MRRHMEGILWLTMLVSLYFAALTPAKSHLLVLIAIVWVGATVVVVPLHFFRAWRRLGSVPNRREYALWVGLETLFAVGLAAGFVSCVTSR
jgi:hypothetical protein